MMSRLTNIAAACRNVDGVTAALHGNRAEHNRQPQHRDCRKEMLAGKEPLEHG